MGQKFQNQSDTCLALFNNVGHFYMEKGFHKKKILFHNIENDMSSEIIDVENI